MTQTAIRAVVKRWDWFFKLVYSWLSPRKRWRAGQSLEMKLSVIWFKQTCPVGTARWALYSRTQFFIICSRTLPTGSTKESITVVEVASGHAQMTLINAINSAHDFSVNLSPCICSQNQGTPRVHELLATQRTDKPSPGTHFSLPGDSLYRLAPAHPHNVLHFLVCSQTRFFFIRVAPWGYLWKDSAY